METILSWIAAIITIGVICSIPFIIFYVIVSWITKQIGIQSKILNIITSIALTAYCFYYLLANLSMSCTLGPSKIPDDYDYRLRNMQGKVLVSAPETLRVFEKGRIIIRISKYDLENRFFIEKSRGYGKNKYVIDKIPLSTTMRVNVKESSEDKKLIIDRLNNNEVQVIDTIQYSEWIYDITPVKYGVVSIAVSVSAMIKTDFGIQELDHPVYEKKIEIYASKKEKVMVFWNEYYLYILGFLLFVVAIYFFARKSIIVITTSNSSQTNFWGAGSLGLSIYIVTVFSIVFFEILNISLWFVPLIFVGTILIYSVFIAVGLRDNDKLSEENFLKLMKEAFKSIHPLHWIFKDNANGNKNS